MYNNIHSHTHIRFTYASDRLAQTTALLKKKKNKPKKQNLLFSAAININHSINHGLLESSLERWSLLPWTIPSRSWIQFKHADVLWPSYSAHQRECMNSSTPESASSSSSPTQNLRGGKPTNQPIVDRLANMFAGTRPSWAFANPP